MVIDQLNAKRGTTLFPIDSFNGKIGDIINVEDNTFHFAKQKDLVGETSVATTNAVKEPVISLKTEGNTFQQTYEGYQLLPFGESSYFVDKKFTYAGLTFTVQADGGIKIQGTSTQKVSYFNFLTKTSTNTLGTYGEGTYTMSLYSEDKQNTIYLETFKYTTDNTSSFLGYSYVDKPKTFSLAEGESFNRIAVTVNGTGSVVDTVVYPLLNYGTEAKPYQQYFGGTPSPNPQYPQPIENANNSKLPSGYQRVEYIESTGTQYIDTGVLGKNTLSFYTKATYASATLFGTQDNSNANKCIAFATTYVRYLTSNGVQVVAGLQSVTNYELEISNTKATVYYNGTSKSANLSPTDTTVDYPIYLFARNIDGNASGFSSVKIYSFKIWDNGTLIRDFIPCYRIADNVVGMYDLVNGVFYTNQGTGEFSKGENIGMSLVNTGLNLFNQEELLTDSDFTKAEYNGFECIKLNPKKVNHKIPCFIPKGTYTLSLDYLGVYGTQMTITLVYEDGTTQWHGDMNSTTHMTNFSNRSRTLTAIQNIVAIDFRCYQIGNMREYYLKNIMVNIGQPIAYLPYFNNTIPIPASVTKADGTVVELRMGKISTTFGANEYVATDYLTVDRLANKVLYHQNIGKATLTKDKNWGIYTYNGKQFFFCRDNLGANRNYNPILADKYFGYATMGAMLQRDYGITTDAVWWGVDYRLSLRDIRFDNVDDFKANLEQNPIEIEYGLAEEITHDITDTELGEKLLGLATEYGVNNFEISSELPVTSLELSCWEQITP